MMPSMATMPATLTEFDFAASGRRVIAIEAQGLDAVAGRLDGAFTEACRLMLACTGRVVCTGMGKSGHVARKIAATLASTGTPSFYVHPGEAGHGLQALDLDGDDTPPAGGEIEAGRVMGGGLGRHGCGCSCAGVAGVAFR